MRENRPYGSEGGASQTNGTSLPPIVEDFAAGTKHILPDRHFVDHRSRNSHRRHGQPDLEDCQIDMDLSRDRSPQQTKSTASPKTPKQWHRRQCPYGFRTRFSRTRENFRYGSEGGGTECNQSVLPRSLTTFV